MMMIIIICVSGMCTHVGMGHLVLMDTRGQFVGIISLF